jgi:hypothetical protein
MVYFAWLINKGYNQQIFVKLYGNFQQYDARMSRSHFVQIVSFGLIGEASDGDSYRHVTLKDLTNDREADLIVFKKKRPSIWADIEELEKGKTVPPMKGYISQFNGVDVVVLGDESLEEAFAKQKWKVEFHKKISRFEADRLRHETKGFCTNLTHAGAMEVSWSKIHSDSKMIKFRYYEGNGTFSWSKWYEIGED